MKTRLVWLAVLLSSVALLAYPFWVHAQDFKFSVTAASSCDASGHKLVRWTFANLLADTPANVMDVTLTAPNGDRLLSGPVSGGQTLSGSFDMGPGALQGGVITFTMFWNDSHHGTDSGSASFSAILSCATPVPSNTPTATSSATGTQPPGSTPGASATTPVDTGTPSATLPVPATQPGLTPHPFVPPSGWADCQGATLTNNSDRGLRSGVYLNELLVWQGDLGVYQTLRIAWPQPVANGMAVFTWNDQAGHTGQVGLGTFGPCQGKSTPTLPVVQSEGSEAETAFTPLGQIVFPSLGRTLPIAQGSIWGDGTFHHALQVAGHIRLNDYGIHQSFMPELALLRPGDPVWIDGQRYWVSRVTLVPGKDPAQTDRLLESGAALVTCTPNGWKDNWVVSLSTDWGQRFMGHFLDME